MTENRKPGTFTKGDSRINRKGRPKSFDALRALAQEIAHKALTQKDGSLITVTEAILSGWAASKDPRLQMQFIDVAFGKVPTPTEVSGPGGQEIRQRIVIEYADAEINPAIKHRERLTYVPAETSIDED